MKRLIISILVALPIWAAAQQPHFAQVLKSVEDNNPALRSAATLRDAKQQEAHVGLLIENPSVEAAYYWGSPTEIGKRWDLSISQSFDMPSVIMRKARIRDLQENAALLGYAETRKRMLLEAQMVCADLVYYRAVARLWESRNTLALSLMNVYTKRLEAGDCSVLDYNRVKMMGADAEHSAVESLLYATHARNQLAILVSDKNFAFDQEEYEPVDLPANFPDWYKNVEKGNPELQMLDNQVAVSDQQARLSSAEWLPEVSVGYASENVVGETFRGVKVGLTLPIWSQPRTVRAAKLNAQAASQELEARRSTIYLEQECLFHHLYALQREVARMKEAFRQYDSTELLGRALEQGEIELETYLQQLDAYYDVQLKILELSREAEQAWLQLNAPSL